MESKHVMSGFLLASFLGLIATSGCYTVVPGLPVDGSSESELLQRGGIVRYPVKVSVSKSVSLTETDVDEILALATAIAQNKDGPNDTACNIALFRDTNEKMSKFQNRNTPTVIDSRNAFEAVLKEHGDIKVVNNITWCEGRVAPEGFSGCAQKDAGSIVVKDLGRPSYNADLWLHEWLHLRGVNYHSDNPSMVMYDKVALAFQSKYLTPRQCAQLR